MRGQPSTTAGWLFTAPDVWTSQGGPSDLLLADVNSDGRSDLIIARGDQNQVEVRLADTASFFGAPSPLTVGQRPQRLLLSDLTGDGIPDLIVAHSLLGSADLRLLPGLATGSFGSAVLLVSPLDVQDIAVADWDGDGIDDLVVANPLSSQVRFLFSSLAHVAGPLVPVGGTPTSLAVADINQDFLPDVVVSLGDGSLRILLAAPLAGFTVQATAPLGTTGGSVAVGDFNGDSLPDVAFARQASASVQLYFGIGGGSIAIGPSVSVGSSPRQVLAVDVNRDGLTDLISVDGGSGQLSLLAQVPGQGLAFLGVLPTAPQPRRAIATPMTNGAPPDIVVASGSANQINRFRHLSPFLSLDGILTPGSQRQVRMRSVPDAGKLAVCGLSLSNVPGIPLPDGRVIPLNIDDLFLFSFTPGNGVLTNNQLVLDSSGQGEAQLYVPPIPGLVGFTFFVAFICLDPTAPVGVSAISPSLNLMVF